MLNISSFNIFICEQFLLEKNRLINIHTVHLNKINIIFYIIEAIQIDK